LAFRSRIVARLSSGGAVGKGATTHQPGSRKSPQQGKILTQRLKDALALIDVRVLDHHIAGGGGGTSLAERGLIWQGPGRGEHRLRRRSA
jgi:DNA repair protein RadC